jgi:dUTP pyrophosphatase
MWKGARLMLVNGLKIFCTKMKKNAIIPTYTNPGDCCCDLYSVENVTIKPGERKLIDTGLAIELPEGFEAQIRPRSGNAWKHGITVLNTPGTIDEQYRNSLKVLLINLGDKDFLVEEGDRIAQMKFSPTFTGYFLERDALSETVRGMKGWGSSGRKQKED